jgi:hypothetical protein
VTLTLFVLGFSIYDYLEPERIRSRSALRDEIASATQHREDNTAKIINAVARSVVAAIPSPKDPQVQAAYIDSISHTISGVIKEALDNLQTDSKRLQFAQQGVSIKSRLEDEIEALGKRGRVNMTIGAIFAFAGIAALGYFALWSGAEYKTVEDLGIKFFPRITFVLLVEIFSYFFLNLYRHSIFEIKYFQNEMTNVESRTLALQGCLLTGDVSTASKICEQLAKTERNFVLKKGEVSLHEREIELYSKTEKSFVQNFKEIAGALGLENRKS